MHFRAATVGVLVTASGALLVAQPPFETGVPSLPLATSPFAEFGSAVLRLPLAAALGAALALRPKRPGTPPRSMPVIETQIILAIVGALIMLVVGASLARAFGIVGAANLIRYRAKIEDPKDAVVMLAALAIGLACGVGLYLLAVVGTVFIGAALWTIESFEPAAKKEFELTIKVKAGAPDLRPRIESVLGRFRADFELRTSADDTVSYVVHAPATMRIDRVSAELTKLEANDTVAVEWDEKKSKKS
jgi:hypothetical protein